MCPDFFFIYVLSVLMLGSLRFDLYEICVRREKNSLFFTLCKMVRLSRTILLLIQPQPQPHPFYSKFNFRKTKQKKMVLNVFMHMSICTSFNMLFIWLEYAY